jgi:hypothetical protein
MAQAAQLGVDIDRGFPLYPLPDFFQEEMNRLLAIAWAKLRCHAYLLFWGMWRGECMLTCHHRSSSRISLIATVRAGDPFLRRIFYEYTL